MSLVAETALYLAAAATMVPLANRLGFGSVLGYLAAGILVGPWALGVVDDPEAILHFAEIGVVLLLFVIGLELHPARLRVFRKLILGLGLGQVVATGAVLTGVAWGLGLDWGAALVVGLGLSLSSTAMVVQMLAERKELLSPHGRASFGVLLFQDMAVIPILALVPALGAGGTPTYGLDLLVRIGSSIFVIAAVFFTGRFLLRPALRLIATHGNQEVFTASALLLVLGTGLAMEWAGLSMGLGAFIAGVLVADTEFRHQLETDIAPFKGLLLGLFFMAVGMSTDLGWLVERPVAIAGLATGLIVLKFGVVFGVARAFGHSSPSARRTAFRLAQGGEFAFVVFSLAAAQGLLDASQTGMLLVLVTVSMIATPFLQMLSDRIDARQGVVAPTRDFDPPPEEASEVIIAGFGRVGQVVGRFLTAQGIPYTALENSAVHVDFVRRFGNEIYYGDPRRLDLLRTAHAASAKIFVLAVDDTESSVAIAATVARHFPDARIVARARNRRHALELEQIGASVIRRETFASSLELGTEVLVGLGQSRERASHAADLFRSHDEAVLARQSAIRDDEDALIQSQRDAAEELLALFQSDGEPDPPAEEPGSV